MIDIAYLHTMHDSPPALASSTTQPMATAEVEARADALARACWQISESTSEADFRASMVAVSTVLGAAAYYACETKRVGSYYINRLMCSLKPTEMDLIKKDYALDPIAAHLRSSHLPIYWDKQTFVAADQLRLWQEQADQLQLTHGIAFPLHLSPESSFFFALDWTDAAPLAPSNRAWAVTATQTVALYAQPAAARIWAQMDLQMTASPRGITERQIECLLWASRGRTDAEIGKILEISARTARKHIDNIVEQLGASSRTEAVAMATNLGLLQSTDSPSVESVVIASKIDALDLTKLERPGPTGRLLPSSEPSTITTRADNANDVAETTTPPVSGARQ